MTSATAEEKNIADLEFVRLRIPRLIPGDLIEGVRGCEFSPEQFYKFQEDQGDNPYNYLYVLVDHERKIHGFLWAHINSLDGSIYVNMYSISKEYWGKGQAIEKVKEVLQQLVDKTNPPKIFWTTTNEKFFLKHGFKRSKNVVMEYNLNKD